MFKFVAATSLLIFADLCTIWVDQVNGNVL